MRNLLCRSTIRFFQYLSILSSFHTQHVKWIQSISNGRQRSRTRGISFSTTFLTKFSPVNNIFTSDSQEKSGGNLVSSIVKRTHLLSNISKVYLDGFCIRVYGINEQTRNGTRRAVTITNLSSLNLWSLFGRIIRTSRGVEASGMTAGAGLVFVRAKTIIHSILTTNRYLSLILFGILTPKI